MNKVHWNSVKPDGKVPDELLKDLLDKSYQLVLAGLSKKKQQEILAGDSRKANIGDNSESNAKDNAKDNAGSNAQDNSKSNARSNAQDNTGSHVGENTGKYLSCCGTDCTKCNFYGDMCKGCNESSGRVFHAPEGKACAIYECSIEKKCLKNCGVCSDVPCDIWRRTKDPSFSDEEFAKNIQERVNRLMKN